ncbi:MAG: cobalt-precorrin-5B (C(1))-methyltransferase CbiD [Thermoplasmatales archaeon]
MISNWNYSVRDPFQTYGITTSATAAASAKASVLAARGIVIKRVGIPTPLGLRLEIDVKLMKAIRSDEGFAIVQKFSGDNPDVLNKLEIYSHCTITDQKNEIEIRGGYGIGVVTREGLPVKVGDKAINPAAQEIIKRAVSEAIEDFGAKIIIIVPKGIELSPRTLNERIGIKNGISILGTTGIEEPVTSSDYIKHLRFLIESGRCVSSVCVLCPGNTAVLYAERYFSLPRAGFILVGDRIGDSIEIAKSAGYTDIILFGLPGKLVKVAAGIMNTHSKVADGRFEVIGSIAAVNGVKPELIQMILNASTVDQALSIVGDLQMERKIMNDIAKRIVKRLIDFDPGINYSTIIINSSGKPLGFSIAKSIKEVISYYGTEEMGI